LTFEHPKVGSFGRSRKPRPIALSKAVSGSDVESTKSGSRLLVFPLRARRVRGWEASERGGFERQRTATTNAYAALGWRRKILRGGLVNVMLEIHQRSEVLNLKQAAAFIGISKAHLSNVIQGKVPGVPPPQYARIGRRILIKREWANEWLEKAGQRSLLTNGSI
jgi:hypothetical protein